ncbi:unnamed protein product [Bursaphelenchus okinawaensis]|uniref:NADH dehydrogenase [ubiquinone] 1 beta subcomplex subunit 3 n=1 Tax=Bursaphelenchus okinawaensis TaxID=465554 RepID=A0A811KAP7_9BILA|nr:unnamed protein product [Bursaphelenchus okinawaensis]CAG9097765.1 unnamed protein product [Bursaphelenchus okinawaensis]
MGHGHHEPFEVPHYTKFSNWDHIPQVVDHAKKLERLGLKDPWIRNFAHRYDPKIGIHQTNWTVLKSFIFVGMKPGLAIAAGVIAIEEAYSYFKKGHTSWGH